jgi:hypothetical protein
VSGYGKFDLSISVPVNHIVFAYGALQNLQEVYTTEKLKRWAQAEKSERTVINRSSSEVTEVSPRPAGRKELT